jgi:AbrB family looped-hinge helix DNA binding protein
MFKNPEFFGSMTVGNRGQIVLPAELRKKYNIQAGDKLIVLGFTGEGKIDTGRIIIFKAELLTEVLSYMEQQEKAIKEILKGNGNAQSKK